MPNARLLLSSLVGALVVACDDAPATAPDSPSAATSTAPTLAIAPALRDALDDARVRLVPVLDDAQQPTVLAALRALDAALSADDRAATRRAAAHLRALLADGDAASTADRAAITMTLDLTAQ